METFQLIINSLLPKLGDNFHVVYHGGEPMLAGKEFFIKSTEFLRRIAGSRFRHFVQTNATLVDDNWARLFKELEIGPSTSMDGPEELHNKSRKDLSGRGTYQKAINGYRKLRNITGSCGAIGVIVSRR